MAGGWGNELMRKEVEFLILDGAMIALASILMTMAHPGIFFPAMRSGKIQARPKDIEFTSQSEIGLPYTATQESGPK